MSPQISIERLVVGQMQANCYLISASNGQVIIIDPGDDASFINQKILDNKFTPVCILATHGHFDHIMAAFEVQKTWKIPFLINNADTFLVKRLNDSAQHFLENNLLYFTPTIDGNLLDRQTISLESQKLKVLATPGHTPGSVCISLDRQKILITGDTLFANGGVGRTDFIYSSRELLDTSLHKIFLFSPDTQILPGHGEYSSLEKEARFHEV